MSERLVIVEDDPIQSDLLADLLRANGFEVTAFSEGARALQALENDAVPADLVLTDVAMPGMDGIELCKQLKESRPELPVVVVTAETNLPTAVNALRAGAYDFLTKPVEKELLLPCVRRALEKRRLVDELRRREPAGESSLFGDSEPMRQVRDLVSRVAPSGASVLVQGETGSGKELVAKALHALSPRSKAPFVAINCAALPASLVESELFGYAKGAFTDARAARQGLFVEADGGTLFLDEVAELSMDNQAKLLRTLQERTVRPLGSNTEIPFDARIMSATHKDLETEAESGRFRQDLFFRLNVIRVDLPPLRERGMDIVHLGSKFLESISKRDGRQGLRLSPEVAQKLLAYPWPGNVRELENCVERLAALARGAEVSVGDLPDKVRLHQRGRFHVAADAPEEIVSLDELEKRYVQHVLTVMQGNRSRAAELLGIDRRTLYRKLDAWGLSGNGNARDPDHSPGQSEQPPAT
jgi:DNA-binding NtrC family response regulator